MPGHPFTHEHRRHAISNCDRDPEHVHDIDSDCILDESADDDQRVTVADLLDAWYAEPFDGNAFTNLRARASDDTRKSWARLFWALEEPVRVHALSPEERAEFDRRTTG